MLNYQRVSLQIVASYDSWSCFFTRGYMINLPCGGLTVGPWFYHPCWVETHLPTPTTTRVYVNLLEGICSSVFETYQTYHNSWIDSVDWVDVAVAVVRFGILGTHLHHSRPQCVWSVLPGRLQILGLWCFMWVCLKMLYPIVPNGFADHYPY